MRLGIYTGNNVNLYLPICNVGSVASTLPLKPEYYGNKEGSWGKNLKRESDDLNTVQMQ